MEKNKAKDSPFKDVFQVGIVVKDMDKATERLSAMGIGPFEPRVLPPDREEWYRGRPLKPDVKISKAYIGETEIELIQPVSGESPHQEFLDSKGEGIQHLACTVEDLDKQVEKLTAQGATVLLQAKFPGGGGIAYVDFGVAGLIIELVERRKS